MGALLADAILAEIAGSRRYGPEARAAAGGRLVQQRWSGMALKPGPQEGEEAGGRGIAPKPGPRMTRSTWWRRSGSVAEGADKNVD